MEIFNANIHVSNISFIYKKIVELKWNALLKEKNGNFHPKEIYRKVFEFVIIHWLLFVESEVIPYLLLISIEIIILTKDFISELIYSYLVGSELAKKT